MGRLRKMENISVDSWVGWMRHLQLDIIGTWRWSFTQIPGVTRNYGIGDCPQDPRIPKGYHDLRYLFMKFIILHLQDLQEAGLTIIFMHSFIDFSFVVVA